MPSSKKTTSQKLPFIDFVPAEVKETTGENWRIVFYVRKPGTTEKKRFRRRVKKISGKQNRMRYAKRVCESINQKLYEGWTPFVDTTAKNEYKLLKEAMNLFLEHAERRHRDNLLRKDTLRSYTSSLKNLDNYMKQKGKEEMFTVDFDKKFILGFLDNIYYTKKRTARTSNNYLAFFSLLASFMLDREYLAVNPTEKIKKRKMGSKKREIIPHATRNRIFGFLEQRNRHFLTLCLSVFFCFIRRTEISKLKVKNISLIDDTIFIPGEISKNKKDGVVTIPKKLKMLLADHLKKATNEDYLFSAENFKPGRKKLDPKKISDEWVKMRKQLNFKKTYQFYSLKDTGITELFLLQVPLIKIRDQARHHDIKITESYTPRNYKSDETIKGLDFNF